MFGRRSSADGGHRGLSVTLCLFVTLGRCFMNSVSQWLHQHDALLLMILVLGVTFTLIAYYRRRSVLLWTVWVLAVGLGTSAAFAIRTPAASLSEHTVQPNVT